MNAPVNPRYLPLVLALFVFLGSTAVSGQDKSDGPASPSDIPIDQIKKETEKAQKPANNETKPAQAGDAATKATPESAPATNDSPKPVPEGTAVEQPACSSGGCQSCCPCEQRCRGQLFGRLRAMFSRRGCGC